MYICAHVYITYIYSDHNQSLKGQFKWHPLLHNAALTIILKKWPQEVASLYYLAAARAAREERNNRKVRTVLPT